MFVGQIGSNPNFSIWPINGLWLLQAIKYWFTPALDIIDSTVESIIILSFALTFFVWCQAKSKGICAICHPPTISLFLRTTWDDICMLSLSSFAAFATASLILGSLIFLNVGILLIYVMLILSLLMRPLSMQIHRLLRLWLHLSFHRLRRSFARLD